MSVIETPITRILYVIDGVGHERQMIFRRLHAVGEGLTLDGQDYEVTDVSVEGDTQRVRLRRAVICRHCGGVAN